MWWKKKKRCTKFLTVTSHFHHNQIPTLFRNLFPKMVGMVVAIFFIYLYYLYIKKLLYKTTTKLTSSCWKSAKHKLYYIIISISFSTRMLPHSSWRAYFHTWFGCIFTVLRVLGRAGFAWAGPDLSAVIELAERLCGSSFIRAAQKGLRPRD